MLFSWETRMTTTHTRSPVLSPLETRRWKDAVGNTQLETRHWKHAVGNTPLETRHWKHVSCLVTKDNEVNFVATANFVTKLYSRVQ